MEQIFGIDLGTTYSCVSGFDKDGRNVIFDNLNHNSSTASAVAFDGYQVTVGEEAKQEYAFDENSAKLWVKRDMGQNRSYHFGTQDEFRPEMVSSLILRKLVQDVKKEHGIDVHRVVITCPAYFGVSEREATRIAGLLAGLDVVAIINEPTAAAIAYSFDALREQDIRQKTILVYDLGGGTFDVTLLQFSPEKIEVIATGGDSLLGGKDWDEALAKDIAKRFAERNGVSLEAMLADHGFMAELLVEAERDKRRLSSTERVRIPLSYQRKRDTLEYTRNDFEECTSGLLAQTLCCLDRVLEEGEEKQKGAIHIDEVLMVGGSSLMPQVQNAVQEHLNLEANLYSPATAVARGAALYARQCYLEDLQQRLDEATERAGKGSIDLEEIYLPGQQGKMEQLLELPGQQALKEEIQENAKQLKKGIQLIQITNVVSKSFGVLAEIASKKDGKLYGHNIIMKNSPLPCKVPTSEEEKWLCAFTTVYDYQTEVLFQVMENESLDRVLDSLDCSELGKMRLTGIDRKPKGVPVLLVSFELNTQGLLECSAEEVKSGKRVSCSIQTTNVLAEGDIPKYKKLLDKESLIN